jgi:hypothetical protein
MKSAYERALERCGPVKQLSAEAKTKLAEIDRLYQAKIAQFEVQFADKIAKAAAAEVEKLQAQLRAEVAKLREKGERDKDRIRNG